MESNTLNAHVIPLLAKPGLRHRLTAHPEDPVHATLLACWDAIMAQLPATQAVAVAAGAEVPASSHRRASLRLVTD